MGLLGDIANIATGGAYGAAVATYNAVTGGAEAVGGAISGALNGSSNSAAPAAAGPSSQPGPVSTQQDPAIVQSNNMLESARIQATTMRMGIEKSSKDSQLQMLAWTTERLDSNDTKLQVATLQAKGEFAAQSNHHVEKMEELRLEGLELKRTVSGRGAGSPDIPEPDF